MYNNAKFDDVTDKKQFFVNVSNFFPVVQCLKWGAQGGGSAPCSDLSPLQWAPLIESTKCYFMPK